MAQTPPPTITPVPTPPIQRGDRVTFSSRVDAFITWLVTAVTQFGLVAANVYNNAVDAFNNATAAAASALGASTSASQAAASAGAAANASGAPAWVSGTTYTAGQVRYSPIDYRSYRRKTNGAGTTDPSADSANWQLISSNATPLLHVRDEKASGVGAGASVANDYTQTRALNTIKTNNITGAALSTNQITLPAGRYRIRGAVPCNSGNRNQAALWNATDASFAILGTSTNATNIPTLSLINGEITISATKSFTVRHFTQATSADSQALGTYAGSGQVEIYTELWIERID